MDARDAIVGAALTASYACVTWILIQVVDLKDQQGINSNEISYMNRTLETCVQRDVYEVDKLLMMERLRND